MIKVGVTGSNGFIGWHLCNTISVKFKKYELIEFKRDWFEDKYKLDLFVSNCDIIVHLAGVNRHNDENVIYNTNIRLSQLLIESFVRTNFNGQLLFASSIQEERDNTFGNSKKAAREKFAEWAENSNAGFKGIIIPNVFGAFGIPFYNSVVSTFCYQLVNNEIPQIENDVTLNLVYIDNVVMQIINLFDSKSDKYIKLQHTDTISVSEILEILIRFKSKYYDNGIIPFFNNDFEINLFNTFRSYMEIDKCFPIKYKNNIDERGNFVEIIRIESGGQLSFSTTKTGITRGNHFHIRKIERFSVIKGNALIKLRKNGTSQIFEIFLSGEHPAYVDMPIWYTHNITNVGNDDLYTIFWINEFYDVNDSDTYFSLV